MAKGYIHSLRARKIELESKTVMPKTYEQIITPSAGFDGLGNVTVNAVDSSIDPNIQADKIKKGTAILGVEGTYEVVIKKELNTANGVTVTIEV